ncbi:type VI secretion system ATPase TssH [Desulfovibrio sp. JC022]|uniref:type VI secretion system ATPase TssH n=1 Tax=Desulfovibrio sp. JC022 TaxID=2593642 RepID=UPI0013D1E06E|nr:type VI secretion system ATPase TssH [Desulfovibrio sp. JC022]NDV23347.1 type VI secretion system ATPase TssH [Desulfovibrio sp. JC022]
MINVDIRNLLSKLDTFCTNALHNAAGLSVSLSNYEVSVEHFFLKCIEEVNSDLPLIFRQYGVESPRVTAALSDVLQDFKTGNSGKPVFSPMLLELFEDAWLISSVELGETRIRSGAVLLAFLGKPNFYASGNYGDLFSAINREILLKEFWTVTKASVEYKMPAAAPGTGATGPAKGEGGFIERFCIDFTAKAREGGIDPVFGRDPEMRQMVDILARRRKNNPILVGEPGVGKTAVIEGMALRITEGDVPEVLSDVTLLGLDMGLLEAGAGMKGEFENRLKGVIDEIKSSETPIILFIDEAHTLVGAGGSAGGADAANLLKPALARGELKTCAATTWTEYKKYFEKDPALARRFQLVKLDEPSVDTSTIILRGLRESYEKAHNVIIRDDANVAAAVYSDRYIAGRFLPDKAIDLLDTTCARVKVNLSAKPGRLEDCQRIVQALEREKKAVDRDRSNAVEVDEDHYKELLEQIEDKNAEAAEISEKWLKEKDAAHAVLDVRARIQEARNGDPVAVETGEGEAIEDNVVGGGDTLTKLKEKLDKADAALAELQGDDPMVQIEVTPDLVGRVVSDWTGIPVGKMARDEAATVADLDEKLNVRIKGQDQGLEAIAEVIRASKAGIKNPDQPIGVFLLVGPSGVGKTETGLSLADLLFGDERSVVTVNMSEFQEKHTVSRLIGSPPGYVGYGEGGMLTEAVRRQPYSVVLLDEVEKAHLDVMNTFYQVFDKGVLTDGEGKDINFKNTILILTSNLGTDVIQEMTAEGEDEMPMDAVLSAVRPILSQHFKPALLARMNVVPFFSLNPEAMKLITKLKLGKLEKMLLANNKMKLSYDEDVVEQIAARCTEVETGARNIEYILNGNVLPKMSKEILLHMAEGGMPAAVHLGVDGDGSFSMEFSAE